MNESEKENHQEESSTSCEEPADSPETRLEKRLEDVESAYVDYLTKWWEEMRWAHYMDKPDQMDVLELPELNGYLSEWNDDGCYDADIVFEKCRECLKIIDSLEFALLAGRHSSTSKELCLWREGIENVQKCIAKKLDYLSFMLLKDTEKHQDPETYNMHYVKRLWDGEDALVTLLLWGNVNRAVRKRGMGVLGYGFRLPEDVVKEDCAVRLLHTAHDSTPLLTEDGGEEASVEEGEETAQLSEEAGESTRGSPGVIEANDGDDGRKENLLKEDEDTFFEDKDDTSENDVVDQESEDDNLSDPSKIPLVEPELTFVDPEEYFAVGGTCHFELFVLPDQTWSSGVFTFITREYPRLRKIHYKRKIVPPRSVDGDTPFNFSVYEKYRFKNELSNAIFLQVQLPKNVTFLEDPLPALWNPEKAGYTTDCIFSTKYSRGKKLVSFKTNQFGVFGMLEKTHQNLPYESWSIVGGDNALLHLNGRLAEVEIAISIDGFKIASLQSAGESGPPQTEEKWKFAEQIAQKLRSLGINIEVKDSAAKFVHIHVQERSLEESVYDCAALLCCVCSFSAPVRSDAADPSEVSLEWKFVDEKDVKRVVVGKDKVVEVQDYEEEMGQSGIEEKSNQASELAKADQKPTVEESGTEELEKKAEVSTNLYDFICRKMDDKMLEKAIATPACFVQNVRSLLRICRPLSAMRKDAMD